MLYSLSLVVVFAQERPIVSVLVLLRQNITDVVGV